MTNQNGNTNEAEIAPDSILPTEYGNFRIRITVDEDGKEHALLYTGDLSSENSPLIRIHSECLTGDALSLIHI